MKQLFDVATTSRKMMSKFLDSYSLDQLNAIPLGCSNNLIWNIGHIIVSQQMLVYKLSGLPMLVSEELVEKYKKGTRPEGDVTQAEVDEIKALLFATIAQTQRDYEQKKFVSYMEYTTSTGDHVLQNAEDALAFSNFHEGLHIGNMLIIRKFI
ncbi:DinB family protein [Flavobacterium tiangeerense]|uniref:DinB family protein n=1 Tax=Flavobacterium tiangeerense TaxID=459471 RepID=A0ABY3FMB9_9FLAO|nr:DinB family protein [Flavobacterium tiangeerense]TWI01343.1 DinB family protein [Flavobacterium tiangeerense]